MWGGGGGRWVTDQEEREALDGHVDEQETERAEQIVDIENCYLDMLELRFLREGLRTVNQ